MANYSNINQIIDNNIYANGNEEITGTVLNNVLKEMVNVLGAGYQFMGACNTSTNPGTPDARVFYLTTEAGTYSNFGGVAITEPTILYYDTTWHAQTLNGTFSTVLRVRDIVNNLNSTSTTKPLSAAMGKILGDTLNNIVDAITEGYAFMGLAATNSAAPTVVSDYNLAYLATKAGTYTNLGNLTVAENEIALLERYVAPGDIVTWRKVTCGSYIKTSDIADNLTTNDATKVLSAKQGKVLGEGISQIDQELNGTPDFSQTIHIDTTSGSAISNSIKYDLALVSGRTYTFNFVSTSVNNISIYFKDSNGNDVSMYADGSETAAAFTSFVFSNGQATRTIKPSSDVSKISFYTAGTNVTGNDGVDCNVSWVSDNHGALYELDARLDVVEPIAEQSSLLVKAFDEKNVNETPTLDRYARYSDGAVAVAGSASKAELIEIALNGEFYIAAFVGSSDTLPAAIAFYNSTTASTAAYMKSASVQMEMSFGKWYFTAVPAGAKLAIISNKYDYVETPIIKTLSAKNVESAVSTSVFETINKTAFYQPFLRKPFFSHHVPTGFTLAQDGTKLIAGESLESIDFAARLGYDYIEANIHQTSDGYYVVTHGSTGKFGDMFYATNGDNISDVAINSKTLDYIKTYVRYASQLDKYKSEILTIDEFLDACAASEIGVFVGTTITDVVDKCVKKLGQDKVILYDAPVSVRSTFGGVMLWWHNQSGQTIAGLLSEAKNYGRPFVSAIGPTVINEFKNDGILDDFVRTMHENGFYCGFASVYQTEAETAELIRLGFDFGSSGAEVNPFDGGTLYDINLPSNITTAATIANGVVTLDANQTLQCGDTSELVGLGKMILRIRFSGELKINFGSRGERTHTSDGSNYLTLSDYSMMRSLRLLITAVSSTTIYDLSYKVLEC